MQELPFEHYLVGGAVRDELLGRPVADRDWVVIGATPGQMQDLGFSQIGKDFPCFLHPETKEEYALARTEAKSGTGHTGFNVDFNPDITLEEDLIRRDLTINAIAKSRDGTYIDPYGGRDDLNKRILRHVSDAFVEDPLRVLRVARFAARLKTNGFIVAEETIALMNTLVQQGELKHLTAERVWQEVLRALTEAYPSEFFRVLERCGALKQIFPELDALIGVPQPAAHHPEIDTFEHVMLCIDVAKRRFDEPMITFAALLHDLGKGVTPKDELPRHIKHEYNGIPLVKNVCQRLKVPKAFAILARLVCEHHLKAHTLSQLKPATVIKLLESLDAFRKPERVKLFARACEADARGRLGLEERDYLSRDLLEAYFEAARQVETKPFLSQGIRGEALGEEIRKARIAAIAAVRSDAST